MIQKLKQFIEESNYIVFFGGAGVSTESNIPDFRSDDGIYKQKYKYPPEYILSHEFFVNNTAEFFDFYINKMVFKSALPNKAHLALAKLERQGKLKAVITQNIDALHQKAGSRNVLELHGSVERNYCTGCGKSYTLDHILNSEGIPLCSCGSVIKPDVVLYDEMLNGDVVSAAQRHIQSCDLLIVGGTSLTVYPAAGMIIYRRGKLVIINRSVTDFDNEADLCISGSIGEILGSVVERI